LVFFEATLLIFYKAIYPIQKIILMSVLKTYILYIRSILQ
jgi:hypothetical protein